MTGRSLDDALSVPFNADSTSLAHVIGKAIAEYEGWSEIRPSHRYQANAIVRALRRKFVITPGKSPRRGKR
jgi:hypothetical protein